MSIFVATCGPTGIGKTYQMQRLMMARPDQFTSVLSVTTRARRGVEDDQWYIFASRAELAGIDRSEMISDMLFREERYMLLRSEVQKALARAPVAFMAIVPEVIVQLRAQAVPHIVINCRVGNWLGYRDRLEQRGYHGEELQREIEQAQRFAYPSKDETWPQFELELGSNQADNLRFDEVLERSLMISSSLNS